MQLMCNHYKFILNFFIILIIKIRIGTETRENTNILNKDIPGPGTYELKTEPGSNIKYIIIHLKLMLSFNNN